MYVDGRPFKRRPSCMAEPVDGRPFVCMPRGVIHLSASLPNLYGEEVEWSVVSESKREPSFSALG